MPHMLSIATSVFLAGAILLGLPAEASGENFRFDFSVPVSVTDIPDAHQHAWVRCCVGKDAITARTESLLSKQPTARCGEKTLGIVDGAIEENAKVTASFPGPAGTKITDYGQYFCRFGIAPAPGQPPAEGYSGTPATSGKTLP